MKVVIDANLAAALVIDFPYSAAARAKFDEWKRTHTELHAPMLWNYEVTSMFRKYVAWGKMLPEEAIAALEHLWDLHISRSYPSRELDRRALHWAGRLNQVAAYDAAYVATAERLQAELWTADRRLANACHQAGLDWVCKLQIDDQNPT